MSSSRLEAQLLSKFENALDTAISEHEEYSQEDLDEIARHKLLVNAIRAFEVDHLVTTSWYKDGDVLTELDNYESEVVATNAGVEDGPIPEIDEIVLHFTEEGPGLTLSDVLDAEDRKQWLKSYYEKHDSIPFEEIYLEGLRIHLHIRRITSCCIRGDEEDIPSDIVDPVVEASENLKSEMRRQPLFRNVPPYLTEFRQIAATILSEFESRYESEELTDWVDVFDELNKFYFNTVWEVIAARIAFREAKGPNEARTRTYRKGTLNVARQTFSVEFDRLQAACREVDVDVEARLGRLPDLEREFGSPDDLLQVPKAVE